MQMDLAHDFNHVLRVVKTAKKLCEIEGAIDQVVIPAAWLHDCFSFPKDHSKRKSSSVYAADKAVKFLAEINYPSQYFNQIHHAIVTHSFSANVTPLTLEAMIVQDADRLDALGAIGVTRCIQVSASLNRPLYHEQDPFCDTRQADDSKYTIDHFYKKLLLIEGSVHTDAAKAEAHKRTLFMQAFLGQLSSEVSE
ncbi:MAG: HD domain-containing protein [Psychromonas sp.]